MTSAAETVFGIPELLDQNPDGPLPFRHLCTPENRQNLPRDNSQNVA